jgi:hypothetical protein
MEEYAINEKAEEKRDRCKCHEKFKIGPWGGRESCSWGTTMAAAAVGDRDRITAGAARF